jgi:Mor family transcriptional regulator
MDSSKLNLCTCAEFTNADPSEPKPTDRNLLLHYIKHGPIQPKENIVRDNEGRVFRIEYYTRFPWLEYSLSKQKAFCFFCRLFAMPTVPSVQGGKISTVFITDGYCDWKKALENKRGFGQHQESKCHIYATKSYYEFIKGKSVDIQLSQEAERAVSQREELIRRNRLVLQRIFNVIRFIARLSLPFRGHDESEQSTNRGVFLELIHYLAENGDNVLVDHLKEASGNATYMSPSSQNECIEIIGTQLRKEIISRVKRAGVYTVMMDETTDCSHKEQVAIFVRYVQESDKTCQIEERMIGLVSTTDTTGMALAELLLSCLSKNNLDVKDIVGQGYDGGSNMRGASKGVQARIKALNSTALFTHCYAHNLNRALVNASCDTTQSDVRNFFGIVELIYTFVEGSATRHAYFLSQQKLHCPDQTVLHLIGLSDTRWNCRASSLRRLSQEKVFRAVLDTIEHVSETTTDGSIRGTAAGLLASVANFKFLLQLELLTPILEAINNVSLTLQSSTLDLLTANQQITALQNELHRLRDVAAWEAAIKRAKSVAQLVDIEPELPAVRSRKISKRYVQYFYYENVFILSFSQIIKQ